MTRTTARSTAAGLLAVLALTGCGGATRGAGEAGTQPTPARGTAPSPAPSPAPGAAAPAGAKPSTFHNDFSDADVRFMTDMIAHHSQATRIAGWAPSHGASPAVQTMAERIVVGQHDEVELMQRWLQDNGQPVPGQDTTQGTHGMAGMAGMSHAGMDHASMPGMLTDEELARLDKARGAEFDRLFLTYMTKHHQGALVMVDRLFGTNGAGQNETVFRLASDIYADQSTEIDRMQKMLATLPPQGSRP
jgi:uncharacterized protein (DUF305 family)